MTFQENFGGSPPFVAGSIRGRRRWEVDYLGRLEAVGNNYRYYPLMPGDGYWAEHWGAYPMRQSEYKSGRHEVAGPNCTCGFYAYFDVDHDEYRNMNSTVVGIFEGFGRATVGPLGFRVERGHIKALVNPFSLRSKIDRIRHFGPAKTVSQVSLFPLGIGLFLVITPLWIVGLGFIAGFLTFNLINLICCLLTEGVGSPNGLDKGRWNRMTHRYPYIPIYKSLALAKKDYPLTDPEIAA